MSDVRAECRARYGDVPCHAIYRSDGTLIEKHECKDWCPLLRRLIEEPCDEDFIDHATDDPRF